MPERPQFLDPSRNRKKKEVVTCTKCGCDWMELISVQQYSLHHAVILGQKPGSLNDMNFWMFRCPKCGETYEPRLVSSGVHDAERQSYDSFVDKMTAKEEKVVKGEKV